MQKPTINLELDLQSKGYKKIVGIDEAGRGPWAGPVVAGAVILNLDNSLIEGVVDSKKLTAKKREGLYSLIIESVKAYGVGIVSYDEIDLIGIGKAVNLAMVRAVREIENKINESVDYLIIDGGTTKVLAYLQQKINKGDLLHYSISAASILAKVTRDRLMLKEAEIYPEYGFEKHMGYGTKLHSDALNIYGPTIIHRKSFKPIENLISNATIEQKKNWKYWRENC